MSNSQLYNQYDRSVWPAILVGSVIFVLMLVPAEIASLFIVVLTSSIVILAYRLNNYFLTVFSGAFLVRVGLIIVDRTITVLPADAAPIASGHNRRAIELVSAWTSGQFSGPLGNITQMRVFVSHVLAPFYIVIGHSPIAGRIAIASVSLLVGYLVFRIARHVTDRSTSLLAASVVLFWPSILIRSVLIQREIISVVALLAVLWAAVQWLDSVTLPTIAVALLATVLIYTLREENLLLVATMVGVVSLVKSRDRPYYLAGLTLLALPFFAYFALNFGQFTGFGTSVSPAALDAFAYGRAHGDAVYLQGLHYNTWLDVLLYAPIKVFYYLFTPLPWHISNVVELVVGTTALGLLVATILARRGIGMLKHEPYYLTLLLSYLVTGVVAYAIIEMNYGAAVRRRIQFVPILLLLTVIGLSNIELDVRWPTR